MRRALPLGLVVALLAPGPAAAHSLQFGVLRLVERGDEVEVSLRAGGREGRAPTLDVAVEGCAPAAPPVRRVSGARALLRGTLRCPDGLDGARVRVAGLSAMDVQVAVRVERADGRVQDLGLLDAARPHTTVRARPSTLDTVGRYLVLGGEHIAEGLDHLLFVLALILVVFDPRAPSARRGRRLLLTVTGFTLGHSVTLSLAALGVAVLPSAPVEACIALSIVVLAAELARPRRDQAPPAGGTFRRPWALAATFGLLHGLGFAGALRELGLPPGRAVAALVGFNAGVELGQLAFVGLALPALWGLHRATRVLASTAARARAAAYAIGAVATVWTVQRVGALVAG
ncbi:MAG TPA: HupE/UreJ family protein [Sandaracinaceae bacterium LLY-WYZ-13_1]|nr:HupE/UreJ family protein [Sandaracinaceae bacterium LLY-WYZ-13_1]